ncbi:hypothetical protein MRX96_013603 [Rhipicephalus microplus]
MARRRRAEARRRAMRATHKVPQRDCFWWIHLLSPLFERCMLSVLRVVALVCWFMSLRLVMALCAVTLLVFGALLIVALVVGGPTLLSTITDFMTDTLRKVFMMCKEFLQNPAREHLFDMAWRDLNL